MLMKVFKGFVFCVTLFEAADGQIRPKVTRRNGSILVYPPLGGFGHQRSPDSVSRALLHNREELARGRALRSGNRKDKEALRESELVQDAERAKLMFDNFQALLKRGREDLGLEITSFVPTNYTDASSATTADFTTLLPLPTLTNNLLRKPIARDFEMVPKDPSSGNRPEANGKIPVPISKTEDRMVKVPELDRRGGKEFKDVRRRDRTAANSVFKPRKEIGEEPALSIAKRHSDPTEKAKTLDTYKPHYGALTPKTASLTPKPASPTSKPASPRTKPASPTPKAASPTMRPTRVVQYEIIHNHTANYKAKVVSPSTRKQSEEHDNGQYFSQFFPQFLEMVAKLSNPDLAYLIGGLVASVKMLHADEKLRFLEELERNILDAADYLSTMQPDEVKELALMADLLFKDDKLADDTREFVDFLNYMYKDQDADHMSLILYNLAHYPNVTDHIPDQITKWLILVPTKRMSGDPMLLRAFINVAMTFVDRFRKPADDRRALPRRAGLLSANNTLKMFFETASFATTSFESISFRTYEPMSQQNYVTDPIQNDHFLTDSSSTDNLRIEYTPLNLRRHKRRKITRPNKRQKQPQTTKSTERMKPKNPKQRRFLIVRRENAHQSKRRFNNAEFKMVAKRFKALSRLDSNIRRIAATTSGPSVGTTVDSLRKYLYDCVQRIMYKN